MGKEEEDTREGLWGDRKEKDYTLLTDRLSKTLAAALGPRLGAHVQKVQRNPNPPVGAPNFLEEEEDTREGLWGDRKEKDYTLLTDRLSKTLAAALGPPNQGRTFRRFNETLIPPVGAPNFLEEETLGDDPEHPEGTTGSIMQVDDGSLEVTLF